MVEVCEIFCYFLYVYGACLFFMSVVVIEGGSVGMSVV